MNTRSTNVSVSHLVLIAWMSALFCGVAPADEKKKSSPAYEAYVRQAQQQAEAAAKLAEKQAIRDVIAQHLALFEQSGDSDILVSLAQMDLPDEEAIQVLSPLLDHVDPGARGMALYGLSRHGAAAASVIGKIVSCYAEGDDEVRWRAAEAIEAIGPGAVAAVAPMIQRLLDPDTSRRVRAATVKALGKIGPAAADAVPALQAQLNHPDSKIAFEAYRSIGAIRNQAPLILDDAASLRGQDGFRGFQAMTDRAMLDVDARGLLHTFLSVQQPVPQRIMALKTLGELKPGDPTSATLLLRAIGSADEFIADTAASGLEKLDPKDGRTVEVLAAILTQRQDRMAKEAAKALARFGDLAAPALPTVIQALERCTGETDYQLIGAYLDILRALGTRASAATPLLTSMLPDDSGVYEGRQEIPALSVRRYLLVTLSEIGVTAESIPVIIDVLANRKRGTATVAAAAKAAGALPSGQGKVIPFLLKALHKDYEDVLVNLRPIDTLFWIPEEDRTTVRVETIRALAKMGPAARAALPLLRERAGDPILYPMERSYQAEAAKAIEIITRQLP